MSLNSNDISIRDNRDLKAIQDIQTREIARLTFNLKQRFYDDNDPKRLISMAKYFETPLIQQNRHIKIEQEKDDFVRSVAELADLKEVMEYQIETWKRIRETANSNEKRSIIVSAETGMGKTEAVIPAVLRLAIDSGKTAILIFPRRALLKDQIQRVVKYTYNLQKSNSSSSFKSPLRFAIQMGGISEKLYWTVYSDLSIDETAKKHNDVESEFIKASYVDEKIDKLSLIDIKCPICGKNLVSEFQFKTSSGNYRREQRNIQANFFKSINGDNSVWSCPDHDNIKYRISFSREDHNNLKPNVIFTTIDSLESLILDPVFGDILIENAKFIVMDEVHVYNGIYGAHASRIIEELSNNMKEKAVFVGLSATVKYPEEFATRLFGTEPSSTSVIQPADNDKNTSSNSANRRFLFLKTRFHQERNYALTTQTMIQYSLILASTLADGNNQALAFMDTLDAIVRIKEQTEDAFNRAHLHELRLDDLTENWLTFEAHSCGGFEPYQCCKNCYIYENGECWAITRHRHNFNTPQNIDILGVTAANAGNRNQLTKSSLIYSTSELELGIDIPNINYLIQYGSPYTTSSFIQRVGRAGRKIGSNPLITMILGEKTSDYIYFRKGSEVLNEPLSTPLNNNNDVINKIHSDLVRISESAINEYKQDKRDIQPYVKEIVDTWKVVQSELKIYSDQNILQHINNIISKTNWNDVKMFKKDATRDIDSYIDQLKEELRQRLGIDTKDPKEVIVNIANEIFEMMPKNVDTSDARQILKSYLEQYSLPDKERTIDWKQVAKKFFEIQQQIGISKGYFKISSKFTELFKNLEKIAEKTGANVDYFREIFYRIQFLEELKDTFGKSSLIEIIKGGLRAAYFLQVSKDFYAPVKDVYPFPQNFFELTRYYCVKNSPNKKTDKISVDDTIYKYYPFRLNTNPNNDIFVEGTFPSIDWGNKTFSLEGVIDYVLSGEEHGHFAFPRIISTKIYGAEKVNGLIKYCANCHKFYDFNYYRACECGSKLQIVKLYSTPNILSSIITRDEEKITSKMSNSRNAGLTRQLIGVSLSLTPSIKTDDRYIIVTKRQVSYDLKAETPYGYNITTQALRISIGNNVIENMINEYRKEFPRLSSSMKENDLENMALHTVAHIWILLTSEFSQVATQSFSYDWVNKTDEFSVLIAENQEGGAGFLDEVIRLIKNQPRRIYDSLRSIVSCDEHNSISHDSGNQYNMFNSQDIYEWIKNELPTGMTLSDRPKMIKAYAKSKNESEDAIDEIMSEYPTCIDGCSNCIAINECRGGKNQLDHISLVMAKVYYDSLILTVHSKDEAAKKIAEGYKVIDLINEGKGGYSFLDI